MIHVDAIVLFALFLGCVSFFEMEPDERNGEINTFFLYFLFLSCELIYIYTDVLVHARFLFFCINAMKKKAVNTL